MKKKVVIFCREGLENFIWPTIKFLNGENTKKPGQEYEVRMSKATEVNEIKQLMAWADVIWLEWGNEVAISLTNNFPLVVDKPVILHLHSYEILTGLVKAIKWEVINHVIYPTEYMRDLTFTEVPKLKDLDIEHKVAALGVDPTRFTFREHRPGYDLAFVAHLSNKKGLMLLLHAFKELVRRDIRYTLHIAGDWQELRYKLYLEHLVKEWGLDQVVKFYGWIDHGKMDNFLQDKSYLISTSPFESQGLGIMEAMYQGVKPVIHKFPGADQLYPEKFLWTEIEDFVSLIHTDKSEDGYLLYDSREYYNYIAKNYPEHAFFKKVHRILSGIKTHTQKAEVIPPYHEAPTDSSPVSKGDAAAMPTTPPGTGDSKRPRLSVCMIIKDEEENLPRCLTSIQGIADELVVVDTGSTDSSVKIAEEFGATVYHHKWQNDFSLHRNQSLSYASGDWILVIDADEELILDGSIDVHDFLSRVDPELNALAVNLKDIENEEVVVDFNISKFFRAGKVSYRNIVHNEAVFEGKVGLFNGGHIKHYGYDISPEKKLKKAERTIGLLKKRIEADPKDYKVYFYLSQAIGYHNPEDLDGIIENVLVYINHKSEVSEFNYSAYFTLIKALMNKGEAQDAYNWLMVARNIMPDDLDISLVMIEFGLWTKDDTMTIQGAQEFIRIYNLYTEQPTKKGGRFIYSHNETQLMFALFHLTRLQINHGVYSLNKLQTLLDGADETVRADFNKNLNEALKGIGVTVQ